MKFLLIINHRNACLSITGVLRALGADFYVPALCHIEPDSALVQGPLAKSLRTIDDPILDTINFYTNATPENIAKMITRLNESYDAVLFIPNIFSLEISHLICAKSTKKVIIYQWGNIAQCDPYTYIPTHILPGSSPSTHPTIYYGYSLEANFASDYKNLFKNKIILPLTLNPAVEKYQRVSNENKKGMVIISRLHNGYSQNLYSSAKYLIDKYKLHVCFYGHNEGASIPIPYEHNFSCDLETLYAKMKESQYLIYLINEPYVVQYSALEAISIGLPVFYLKGTLLGRLIGESNYFECNSLDEMGSKITAQNFGQADIKIQKNCLKYFSSEYATECWNKLLSN